MGNNKLNHEKMMKKLDISLSRYYHPLGELCSSNRLSRLPKVVVDIDYKIAKTSVKNEQKHR